NIEGVYTSGIHSGIKKDKNKLDLAYIYLPNCIHSAGVFTKNHFKADCVIHNQEILKDNIAKAIIINSGNANVITKNGMLHTKQIAKKASKILKIKKEEVAISSTGIIGVDLPVEKILDTLPSFLETLECNTELCSKAILTTDTYKKEVYLEEKIGSETIKIAGIAKGSGMIAPNMATMLSYIVCNVKTDNNKFQQYLSDAVNLSFNRVSVDTDTSTSDSVIMLSSGDNSIDLDTQEKEETFIKLLNKLSLKLAKLIARDGEGATKLIEVKVINAEREKDALIISRNIAESPLVKTAVHGEDPNWGRIVMAIGKNPEVKLDVKTVDIFFQDEKVLDNSIPTNFDREKLHEKLSSDTIKILVDLKNGDYSADFFACDLTKGYIDINTEYN
ncbi:UNVERIFIED_CONTAM: hypothetical protein GTU68_022219, partial [Idotea baltica]|nr:hypothetical protein [Idotea baltica]